MRTIHDECAPDPLCSEKRINENEGSVLRDQACTNFVSVLDQFGENILIH
jgi:hypothetical protein